VGPRWSRRSCQAIRAACRAALPLVAFASIVSADPRPVPDGPTGTVSGRIVRSDGPKYDIHVIDQETWMSVITRTDGTFRFERLPVGSHLFRIRSDWCGVQLVPVTVRADQVSTLEICLTCKPRPCPKPDRADPTCIVENPAERARVGRRCEVHPGTRLQLDLVEIHHGIASYVPGMGGDERQRFPNARPWWGGGCVDHGIPFTEVAYCSECRKAYARVRLPESLRVAPWSR
jgi:hypothetical protein